MGVALGLLFGAGLSLSLFHIRFPKRVKPIVMSEVTWAPFIDDVSSAIRAGMMQSEALWSAAQRLPAPQALLFEEAQAVSEEKGFANGLKFLRAQSTDFDVLQLLDVLTVVQTTGSSTLASTLSQLSMMARARAEIRNEIRARQAVTITAARVAVAAPWIVLLLTSSRPQTRSAFSTAIGLSVLVVIAVVSLASYLAMNRLSRIKELAWLS